MVTLENYLAVIGQWVFVAQGLIFVACVFLFRRGMIGELARLPRALTPPAKGEKPTGRIAGIVRLVT
jgi:hypothetical protein